jgi:hypothetical protein
VFDLFVAMTAAAAATTTLRIGSGCALVPERDPIVTAKQVASVDVLSGGRVLFGVGVGWVPGGDPDPSGDPSQRWAVQRDGYGHLYPPSSSTYAWHAVSQPPYRSAEQSPLRVVAVWGWRQVDDVRHR